MEACFDRLRCEVFQNLFLSPMNTGFVRPAVATVLTVYGIETFVMRKQLQSANQKRLQQYLPFTVLKLMRNTEPSASSIPLQQYLPFTVLKQKNSFFSGPATASCNSTYRLRY